MDVEQTTQLIQLILNSVLMVTACVVVLGVLLMRHTAIHGRLRSMNQEYFQLLGDAVVFRGDRLLQVKHQLLQFRNHYSTTYFSLMLVYLALMTFGASTLLLALRTLVNWQWLITLSLTVFMVGMGVLLSGVGLSLVDFCLSRRSLLEEMNWVLGLGDRSGTAAKSDAGSQRRTKRSPRSSQRSPQRLLPSEDPLQHKIVSG